MNKRKIAMAALAAVTLSCAAAGLAACGAEESYYNLYESGTIYYEGEQTVKLSISDSTENKTTFKDSITKDDVTLSGVLSGKTVTSATYVSATEVSLVLDGAVTANETQADDYGTITVAKSAMANNATANCIAKVDFNPQVTVVSNSYSTIASLANCSSTFKLPYGSFIESNVTTDNIIVPADDVEVVASVTTEGYLKICVHNYLPVTDDNGNVYKYPIAKISANVTTFNTDLYVYIGTGSVYGIKSTATVADGDDEDRLVTDGTTSYTKGLEFSLNSDGATYSVSAYTRGNPAVVIPDTYNGKPVTAVGSGVFKKKTFIKSVQLGANVETIGADAFSGCTSLKKLLAADGSKSFPALKTIGDNAFNSTVLVEIGLPSVTSVGDSAFKATKLKSIELPSIQTLGASAFASCTSLESVTFSASLNAIPDSVFNGCSSLASVYGVSNVNSIGSYAFYNCSSLVSFGKENVISLSESISSIGELAFADCSSIEKFEGGSDNIVVSNGVLHSKNTDSTLTLLTYPAKKADTEYTTGNNVSYISDRAFALTTNLKTLTLSDSVTNFGENILGEYADTDTDIDTCGSVANLVIGNGLTKINDGAFTRAKSLVTVTISDSVKSIGAQAFYYCINLKTVNMGQGVQSIYTLAFFGCAALQYIKISDSVEFLGNGAFRWSGLQVAEIGVGVKKIEADVFKSCWSLQYIIIGNDGENGEPELSEITSIHSGCLQLKAIVYCAYKNDLNHNVVFRGNWNRDPEVEVICKDNYDAEEDDEYNAGYFKYQAALQAAKEIVDAIEAPAE